MTAAEQEPTAMMSHNNREVAKFAYEKSEGFYIAHKGDIQ